MLRDLYPELFSPMLQSDGGNGGGTNGGGEADGNGGTGENGGGEKPKGTEGTGDQGGTENDGKITFSAEQQDHIQKLIDAAVGKAVKATDKTARQDERQKIENERKNKDAEEQGDYKTLYEQEKEKREALEAKQAEAERKELQRAAADKYKLPAALAELLQGETEADLAAHAQRLAREIGAREAPDTNGGKGGNGSVHTGKSADDDTPAPKDKPNVDPGTMPDGRKKVAWVTP